MTAFTPVLCCQGFQTQFLLIIANRQEVISQDSQEARTVFLDYGTCRRQALRAHAEKL